MKLYFAFVELFGYSVDDIKEIDGFDINYHPYSFFDYLCFLEDNSIKYYVRFLPSSFVNDDIFNFYLNNDSFAIFYFDKRKDLEW